MRCSSANCLELPFRGGSDRHGSHASTSRSGVTSRRILPARFRNRIFARAPRKIAALMPPCRLPPLRGMRSLFALGLQTLRKIFFAANPAQIIVVLGQLLSQNSPLNHCPIALSIAGRIRWLDAVKFDNNSPMRCSAAFQRFRASSHVRKRPLSFSIALEKFSRLFRLALGSRISLSAVIYATKAGPIRKNAARLTRISR